MREQNIFRKFFLLMDLGLERKNCKISNDALMKLQSGGILRVEIGEVKKRGAERLTMMLITAAPADVLESSEGKVSGQNEGDYPVMRTTPVCDGDKKIGASGYVPGSSDRCRWQ